VANAQVAPEPTGKHQALCYQQCVRLALAVMRGCVSSAGARDVVFFMHGILDTAMGWVCNGVTGSNAFAAYDAGFDVWLGNSRANPPRLHMGESCTSLLH
jgi:hypothetical protein